MSFTPNVRLAICLSMVPLVLTAWFVNAGLHAGRPVHADQSSAPQESSIRLGTARAGETYGVTVSVKDPAQLQSNEAVHVVLKDAQGEVASKWLHASDLDFYLTLRPREAGPVTVNLSSGPATASIPQIATSMELLREAAGNASKVQRGVIAAAPNGTWQNAQPFEFGQTIFGSDDERPYAPSKNEDGYAAMLKGFQWFKFTFREKQAAAGLLRSQRHRSRRAARRGYLPVGQGSGGKPDVVPFTNGEFVYQVEATQNYPGLYKFRTRILAAGPGILRARGRQSSRLSTAHLRVPRAALHAIRTRRCAPAWISWSTWATPGFRTRRAAEPLPCAPPCSTPKRSSASPAIPRNSPRAAISKRCRTATRPRSAPASSFLTDRIYNNARPLYGEPNTNWVRIIYTARTVASRLPLITHAFEQNVTHDPPRKNFDVPYAEFLKIHYKGVTEMPGDEADGCEPDVSPFEIATQSWQTFDMAYKRDPRRDWLAERDHVEQLAVALRAEEHDRPELEDHVLLGDRIARSTQRKSTSSSTSSTNMKRRRAAGPIPFDKTGEAGGLHLLQRRAGAG